MNRVRSFLAILLLGTAGSGHAEALRFDGQRQVLKSEFAAVDDPTGQLTIEQVSAPEFSGRFLPAEAFKGKVGESSIYWLRVAVVNTLAEPATLALTPRGSWEDVQLHSGDGSFAPRRSGQAVPAAERDLHLIRDAQDGAFFTAVSAPLMPAAQATWYLRIKSDWNRYEPLWSLYLEVNDLARLRADERRELPIQGLFFGLMLALAIYHLMLLTSIGDVGYGYYVMHIAGIGLTGASFYGLTFEYLFPAHPHAAFDAMVVWRTLAVVGLAQFCRVYLDTRRSQPWLDVALRVVVVVGLLACAALPFVPATWLSKPISLTMLACVVLGFVTGINAWRKGSPLARYFLAGNVFTVVGFLVTVGDEIGFLSWVPWAKYSVQIGVTLEALMLSRGLAFRFSLMRTEIERRERSEVLLRNMLPAAIAEELRRDGRSTPSRHEEVSILFTDFVGFTQAVSTIPPQRMVAELNEIFQGFDDVIERHGLEKIKTIGDAYMAAAGVPEATADHALRAVRAALEMQQWLAARNRDSSLKWALRLGIHSGPVVAGVVGRTKYAYDIWGDTVNIASRMESSGESGKVNISAYTYDLVRDQFECSYRGKVAAKGKGEIDMYFVVGPKR